MGKAAAFWLSIAGALLFLQSSPSHAADAPEAEVRARLAQWTEDFNAGRADKVCDLFAADLVSNFRGQPERGYDELCGLLQRSLGDGARSYSYALDLKEVIVSGDLAVVRLVWTLTIASKGGQGVITSVEPGIDIFRRQPDGKWRISRYMAYEEESP
jgi:steroid delta-isomerase